MISSEFKIKNIKIPVGDAEIHTGLNNNQEKINDCFNRIVSIIEETQCDIIYTAVISYIEGLMPFSKFVISKQLLNRALILFSTEHKDEFCKLCEQSYDRVRKSDELFETSKDDDIKTMEILFNADINELCNQKRFNDAEEMTLIRDRLIKRLSFNIDN